MKFINYNGEIYPSGQAVVTIHNRAFRYGDGLFESMKMVKGELKFAELHADRLQRGMKALKLEGYSQFDAWFLRQRVEELAKRNKITQNARIRLTVFREGEGLYSPAGNKAGYAMEISKAEDVVYKSNGNGLIIDVFQDVTKPVNALSNYKTCNSLVYVLAGVFKQQHKLDEALILNQHGFLCEAISSNVFVVYDKQIYTPALTEGCVEGIMRSVVMDIAAKHQLPVTEAQINPQILNEADELFVTNATRGIQWVMGYNRKRYFYEVSRFLTDKLNSI
ncbi:aminotransferase class IV [Pedobacter sp. BS3]|uniref:aminotransferase class IV n=1 Tax=Pedobacter sp. BS3 TaxID=2567937 RepID=UPI0011ED5B23|nr:aminotransferase class IV [Pedobacter sp. BS3]TZF83713.1 aminotransferase class IV [Pedobacter sp. BS3]